MRRESISRAACRIGGRNIESLHTAINILSNANQASSPVAGDDKGGIEVPSPPAPHVALAAAPSGCGYVRSRSANVTAACHRDSSPPPRASAGDPPRRSAGGAPTADGAGIDEFAEAMRAQAIHNTEGAIFHHIWPGWSTEGGHGADQDLPPGPLSYPDHIEELEVLSCSRRFSNVQVGGAHRFPAGRRRQR